MSYLVGGDSDKRGNYFENKFIVSQLARLLSGEILSVQQETYIQNDEKGVDVIVEDMSLQKIFFQCKSRNGTKETWDILDLKSTIMKAFKHTSKGTDFVFISPIPYSTILKDFCDRSKTFENLSDFELNAIGGKEQAKIYQTIKSFFSTGATKKQILNFFQKFRFEYFPDDEGYVKRLLSTTAQIVDNNHAYELLCDYVETNNKIGKTITVVELRNYLSIRGISFYNIDKDNEALKIIEEQHRFKEHLNRKRINGIDYNRNETKQVLDSIKNNRFTIVYGEAGCGKSIVIKQVCDELSANNIIYLPISFNNHVPEGSLMEYSKKVGLSSTIGRSLNFVSGKEKAFLILDQLDSIRWNTSLTQRSIDLCGEIIEDALRYDNISIIFVIRKIDIKHIQTLIEYENSEKDNSISKVEVNKIDEKIIRYIVSEYDSLSITIKKMLKTIGNIKLYLEIKNINKKLITTTPELIKKYLDEKIKELKSKGFYDVEKLLSAIVECMKKNNSLTIAKGQVASFSDDCLEALKKSGLIEELEQKKISFTHQTLFDYHIAYNLYDDYINRIPINKIILKYNKNVIEKFEAIKQFFELLLMNHPNDFCFLIQIVLFDYSIRFFIRRLALNFYISINDDLPGYKDLLYKIIKSKEYGQEYLYELSAGKKILIRDLIDKNVISNLLKSDIKSQKELAINILLSDQSLDDIFVYIKEYIDSISEKSLIENIIYRIDDINSSDELFKIKIDLIKKSSINNHYIFWNNLILHNVKRAYSYLELIFDENKRLRCQIDIESEEKQDDLNLLFDCYGQQINNITKNYLFKLENAKFKIMYYDSNGVRNYDNDDRAILLFAKTIKVLNVNTIIEYMKEDMLKGIVFNEIVNLENEKGLAILKRVITDNIISSLDFQYDRSLIFKLKKIIEKFLPSLSICEINNLEIQILKYKRSDLIEFAKERLKQRKLGYFYHFYGEEQKVLLEGILFEKLSYSTQEYLKCLQRKFVKPEYYDPSYKNGVSSYSVISGINRNNKELSRKTIVKMISSEKTGKKDRFDKEAFDKNGNLLSTDRMHFNSLISDLAYSNRPLFIDILMTEKAIKKDFISTILSAVSNKYSNKECKIDCDEKLILEAHKKYYDENDLSLVTSLISFAQNYDLFDEWLITQLINLSYKNNMHNDNNGAKQDFASEWSSHFSNTQSGAISALSRNMWKLDTEPIWFDSVFDTCLNCFNAQVAISGIDILYPFYNINKKKCIELLYKLLYEFPMLIESNEVMHIIDLSIVIEKERFIKFVQLNLKFFSKKAQSLIENRLIAYYCLYELFKNEAKKVIKNKEYNQDEYNFGMTFSNLIVKHFDDVISKRITKCIKWTMRYNSIKASNLFIAIDKNIKFFENRNLIIPLIKKSVYKNDKDAYIRNLEKVINDLPKIIEYKHIIFAVAESLLKKSSQYNYHISTVIQWLVAIYWEIPEIDFKFRKKCLNIIDNIYSKFHLTQEISA